MAIDPNVCSKRIRQRYGDQVDAEQLDGLINELTDLKKKMPDIKRFRVKSQERGVARRHNEITKQTSNIKQKIKTKEVLDFIEQNYSDDPIQGLMVSLRGGDFRGIDGAGNSASAKQDAIYTQITSDFNNFLERSDVKSYLKSRESQRTIFEEKYQLESTGESLNGTNTLPHQIAQEMIKADKRKIQALRDAGLDVGEYQRGYGQRLIVRPEKAASLGKGDFNQQFRQHVDIEQTFGRAMPDDELNEFIDGLFDEIVRGQYFEVSASGNIQNKLKARDIVFKSGSDHFEFNEKLGGEDLFSSFELSNDIAARRAALADTFGPDPEESIEGILRSLKSKHRADQKKLGRITGKEKHVRDTYKNISGETRAPARNMAAHFSVGARMMTALGKLGSSTLNSMSEIANSAAWSQRAAGGQSYLGSLGRSIYNFGRLLPRSERERYGKMLKLHFDDLSMRQFSRFDSGDALPGHLAQAQRLYFKFNGLSAFTADIQMSTASSISYYFGSDSGKKLSQLHADQQSMLRDFGIKEREWDILSQAIERTHDGDPLISASKVEELPADLFDSPKHQRQLANKWQQMLLTYAKKGASIPDPSIQAHTNQGLDVNSPLGAFSRVAMQLKQFPLTMIANTRQQVVSRGKGDGFFDSIKKDPKSTLSYLSQHTMALTAFGYGSLAAADLISGREPRSPGDKKVMTDAMIRGGVGGIYGDFLLGEFSRGGKTALSNLAGPTFGMLDDVMEMKTQMMNGNLDGGRALNFAVKNSPLNMPGNLFYTKYAYDYLVGNAFNEWASPGYQRRMERRAKETPGVMGDGQEFFLPPPSESFGQ